MKSSTRRRLLVLSATAVVCLVAAETATRLLSPYLTEPLLYGDDATQVKVAQMDHLGPECTDVVLAGDSTGRDGFDPATYSSADPQHRRAYNASLDAASPELLQRWLTSQVVPRLTPSTVIIAVSSLDLNAHGAATASATRAYDDALATGAGAAGATQAWFVQRSALVRYRTDLRDPSALGDAVSRWRDGSPAARMSPDGIEGLIGPAGEGLSRRPLHYQHDAGTKAFTRDELLAGYTIDQTQVDALTHLVTTLHAGGTTVALAILPVTDDYIALHPHGRDDFDAFVTATHAIASSTGTPIIDLHDQSPPADAFADTHHLNGTGSTWLSAKLPALLAGAGALRDVRCP